LSESAQEILTKYWGYKHFRALQSEIIDSILSGNDTVALLPTGGGKSICYQVPAIMKPGLCIVISPLISLIRDQVRALLSKGVPTEAIYSGMYASDIERVLNNCLISKTKLLYVSPERLKSGLFLNYFDSMDVSFIAIDEAHCISQWGYDFRPAYLEINQLKEIKPELPILALTATATEKVLTDIKHILEIPKAKIFRKSFLRDNIHFSVYEEINKRPRLLSSLDSNNGPSIIYMRSRAKTMEISDFLIDNGYKAASYHAGMSMKVREKVQDEWMKEKTHIMVATTAFGMGIDKSNVRAVIHLDLPMSPEEFYQEAGRAGRDGKESNSVVIFNQKDIDRMYSFIEDSYPPPGEITEIYQGMAGYFRVASGIQSSEFYDFDIAKVAHHLKKSQKVLLSALKILEWNEYIIMTDAVEMPDQILILYNKRDLFELFQYHPEYKEIMEAIMRMYGGVFNLHVKINLNQIAIRSNHTSEDVARQLNELSEKGVISFIEASDKPKVSFGEYRYPPEYLTLDMSRADFLKERAVERAKAIEQIFSLPVCRNMTLLSYFGEVTTKECGNCDICLQNSYTNHDHVVDQKIKEICSLLTKAPVNLIEFKRSRVFASQEKASEKALQYLFNEQIIYLSDFKLHLNEK
jgi:ATP-dependent DNA helicase RecQ